MVEVVFEIHFKKDFQKIRDKTDKIRIIKQIQKIKLNPEIGKPMQHDRKGTRELYVSPFRLSYKIEKDIVYILAIYHKDDQ